MSLLHPVNTSLCLEKLCESNYQKLLCLIPELSSIHNHATAEILRQPALFLTIIEKSKHTLTIELSHHFNNNQNHIIEPAVKIRVYLDANTAEVLKDHARKDVSKVYRSPRQSIEIMNYKWRLNYFLQKWLDHCLQTNYQFKNKEYINLSQNKTTH